MSEKREFTGWGIGHVKYGSLGKRPFSEREFANSALGKGSTLKNSYEIYLAHRNRIANETESPLAKLKKYL